MITVNAAVTTELATGTSEIAWFIDLVPKDGTNNFRLTTSSIVPTKAGYINDALLIKPISFKKKLGQEFDKYQIEIATAESGAVNSNIDDLYAEFVAGTLDQATVTIGFYTASNEEILDICRVYKTELVETTLSLTATNEIESFAGKLPNTPHEPQSWNRIEDKGDNPDTVTPDPWQQLDTPSETSTTAGRYRKGLKITATERQGFARWWTPRREDDDKPYYYPIAYGQKVIMQYTKKTRGEPVVLSLGETGNVYQLLNADGDIRIDNVSGIAPVEWSSSTYQDPFDEAVFVVDSGETPRYTALSALDRTEGKNFYIVFDGRKHYSYDANGVKQGSAAVAHSGRTNPIWVFVDLCMNVLGLKWAQIDWTSAYNIATELDAEGFDLRFIIKDRKKKKDYLNKIAKNGGFLWQWSGGKIYFSRRYASTDPTFTTNGGWLVSFTDADIEGDSFNYSDQSLEDAPNKFDVTYLSQGQDPDDRYYHRIMQHSFEVMDKDYTKEISKALDYEYLYDPNGFDSGTPGTSLPQLEVIKEIRMSRVQKRFTFRTKNLNAFLLQGADPVEVDYTVNTLDFGNPNPQDCEVESLSYGGGGVVDIVLKPRADTWFDPDPKIGINTDLTWATTGAQEGNIPTFRFSAPSAGNTPVKLRNYDGSSPGSGVDKRALAPGNALWVRTDPTADWSEEGTVSGGAISTRYWEKVGIIQSVTVNGSDIEVTLDSPLYAVAQYARVQCQPATYHYNTTKNTTTVWKMHIEHHLTDEWNYMATTVNAATTEDAGVTSYSDTHTLNWATGENYLTTDVEITDSTGDPAYNLFPGVAEYQIRTLNGIEDTKYVYCFSVDLAVSKGVPDTPIAGAAITLKGLPVSDFSEIGVKVGTSWDPIANPNALIKLEYKVGNYTSFSTADGTMYGTTPAVPFDERLFIDNEGGTYNFTENIDFTEYLSLKLTTYESDGVTPIGSASYVQLQKVNHFFSNYIGAINTYATYLGSGMVLATRGWSKFSTSWDTSDTVGTYAGGLHLFGKTGSSDPLSWRRRAIVGTAYIKNSPTVSFEVNGDSKLAYWNDGNASDYSSATATVHESGCLFYAFKDDSSNLGEANLGLNKTYGRQSHFYLDGTVANQYYFNTASNNLRSTGSIPNQGGSGAEHRGAALVICRSTYGASDIRWKPNVLASNLGVQGLLIGGQSSGKPSSTTLSYPLTPSDGRVFFCADLNDFGGTATGDGDEKFLVSAGYKSGGTSERWQGYVYTNSESSLVIPPVYQSKIGDTDNIKIYTKTSTTAWGTKYAPWSDSQFGGHGLNTPSRYPYIWKQSVNGSGLPELIVTSTDYPKTLAEEGAVYVYLTGGKYYLRVLKDVSGTKSWISVELT